MIFHTIYGILMVRSCYTVQRKVYRKTLKTFRKKGNESMTKRRKFAVRCTVIALAAAMLSGCSGERNIISYESGEVTKADEKSPEIGINNIKAALLLPDDPTSGACMSSAHANAFEAAASELGISSTIIKNASPDEVEELTKDSNVIFGSVYDYMNPFDEASKENPDKLYSCFGGYKYNSTNYTNYYAAIYEAQYLAGIVAGTNSKSGKIGIISEHASDYPDSAAEINSFAIGAKAANADVKIFVKSLHSRTDTSKAKDYAEDLVKKGCDVISIQCDSTDPAVIAANEEIRFIGYGTDTGSYDGARLASLVWDLKEYYRSALKSASNGTWADENYYGNLYDGAVALVSLSGSADKATADKLLSAANLIKNNSFEIFSNQKMVFDAAGKVTLVNAPLIDNKGNTMISEDGTSYFIYSGEELKSVEPSLATSDKMASSLMNYLVDAVTVIE